MAGTATRGSASPELKLRRYRHRVERVISLAAPLPAACADPALVVLSGLPGSGKTTFARRLREAVSIGVIESDAVRAALFASPRYTKAESGAVFEAIHGAAAELLRRGFSTLIDATNLIEAERAIMYRVAADAGGRLVVVRVTAPVELIRARLAARSVEQRSAAGLEVYERMVRREQPISVRYVVVDTGGEVTSAVEAVVREIRAR